MQIEYLIVGQGICGTWLSYYLEKAGKSYVVIDELDPFSSTRISAGVINPVTGRRHVTVWRAAELISFCRQAYSEMGRYLGMDIIEESALIDFFPTAQMRQSFTQRTHEHASYLSLGMKDDPYRPHFNFELGFGEIKPIFIVHIEALLPAWRNRLSESGKLRDEKFDTRLLQVKREKITYQDYIAQRIIFCDGIHSAQNPWFQRMPFALNKGEILILEIPGLPANRIYKKGMVLVPLRNNRWWAGSNYQWEFSDDKPSAAFKIDTEKLLSSWLRLPFKVTDHLAGVRPATLERRPFVGFHPGQPNIGILNGMGAKGCSLGPYFAKEMADHLVKGTPITPEADIHRFEKILLR